MLAYEGWLKEGLCREEHSNDADFGLDGRQPSEETCELGFGGKADDLTNKAVGNFGLALRIATPLDQLFWKRLPQLGEAAAQQEETDLRVTDPRGIVLHPGALRLGDDDS